MTTLERNRDTTVTEDADGYVAEQQLRTRIRDAAITRIGQHGFKTPLKAIADAAGVSQEVLLDLYGSKRQLLRSCDEYILESIRSSKSAALQSHSPATWFAALSNIESYAPLMAYLVRSMEGGGELGRTLIVQMIDNAVDYLEDGVRAGTIKPSRNPKARATFLALNNGGGFLLYRRLHPTPSDMAAVLRDYAEDMIVPALELYTQGLLAESTMMDAFTKHDQRIAH
jgi:AcrR family transcriptional regulator